MSRFGLADEVGRVARGDQNAGDDAQFGLQFGLDVADDIQARDDSHLIVEQAQVDRVLIDDFEGLFAAFRFDDPEERLQQLAERFPERGVVVDDQQFERLRGICRHVHELRPVRPVRERMATRLLRGPQNQFQTPA